jgi:hypothetical protein
MDGVWAEWWGFAERARSVSASFFLFLFFPRSYGTGTPFLAERAEARQDFFSFFNFFFAAAIATGYFRA